MQIPSGTRLGFYEVLAPLGAGGMGDVYRARDTRLGREVALKLLPEQFAADPERLARFTREAELLASLNHPNIAAIYGLENTNRGQALVLELVEGQTLAERLRASSRSGGGLPLADAVSIARQVAEALEAAHERGIIHRDLKPANIKVRADGTVKVLDFGLAKALLPDRHETGLGQSDSPTTLSGTATSTGVILGTAAYMSPEQAKGQPLDRRTDVFAFGAVLYELLTGQPAFAGGSVAEVLAAVLQATPDWDRLPADTPPGIRRLLHRCLDKEPKRRLQSAADARIRIEEVEADAEDLRDPRSRQTASGPKLWVLGAATLVALMVVVVAALPYVRPSVSVEAPEFRLDVQTPPTTDLMSFALSPDGRYVVFAATDGRVERLWLRRLDVTTAQPLAGTEDAGYPFWAPNSRSIGFFAGGKLKRLDLDGGAPQTLADAAARGGAWGPDGTIVFPARSGLPRSGLLRVPASGGQVVEVTRPEEERTLHRAPQFLPDGRRLLLFVVVRGVPESTGIYLGSLDSPAVMRLTVADTPGRYLPGGWVLFPRGGTLLAQRLDLERGALSGDAVTVADSVASIAVQGTSAISVSSTGLIAYRTAEVGLRQLSWFDRSGAPLGALGAPDASGLSCPRLSSDGLRAAVHRTVQRNQDIWLLDGTRTSRFTVDAGFEQCPVWSPDGRYIVFDSNRAGTRDLYLRSANGAGEERTAVTSTNDKVVTDWSRDGRFMAYEQNPGDLWIAPMQGGGRPFVFLRTNSQELEARFSPDGRWVAYKSNESGQFEVYVRPFSGSSSQPADGGQWQVSSDGGVNPRWSADGRELYYVSPDGTLMAVPIAVDGITLKPGAPVVLFRPRIVNGGAAFYTEYDVARDGRFLINTVVDEAAPPITIIQNWKPPAQ